MKRALLLLALAACKSRGTIELTTADGGTPAATTQVHVYAIADLACDCDCGRCAAQCTGDDVCVRGNDGALIPLGEALSLDLHAGAWAVIVEYLDADQRLLASACTNIDLEDDGTEDKVFTLEPTSCEP